MHHWIAVRAYHKHGETDIGHFSTDESLEKALLEYLQDNMSYLDDLSIRDVDEVSKHTHPRIKETDPADAADKDNHKGADESEGASASATRAYELDDLISHAIAVGHRCIQEQSEEWGLLYVIRIDGSSTQYGITVVVIYVWDSRNPKQFKTRVACSS